MFGGPTMAVIALKCPHINVNVVGLSMGRGEKVSENDHFVRFWTEIDTISTFKPLKIKKIWLVYFSTAPKYMYTIF